MAKGQKRSNREIKKPKKDKTKVEVDSGTVTSTMAKAKSGNAPQAAAKK